jgi:hypothetical protein
MMYGETSPIDRSMMMVEIGSSIGNAAKPKLPPTAPEVERASNPRSLSTTREDATCYERQPA